MPDTTERFYSDKKSMTEADAMRLGNELAKLNLEIDAKKEEKANVVRTYRVAIRQLEERSHSVSSQLDAGKLDIKIPVEEVPDDSRMMIQVLRADTRELITDRPMNEVEKEQARKRKQTEMSFAENGGKHDTERAPARRGKSTKVTPIATAKKNGKKSS